VTVEGEAVSGNPIGAEHPLTRPSARAMAMAGYAALAVLWIWFLGVPKDTVGIFLWLWLATIAWNIEAPRAHHLIFLRDWWVAIAWLVVYFYSRGFVTLLGLPVHVMMPVRIDEWLGGGMTISEHLQRALCGNPCLPTSEPRWYDSVLTTVYVSHFVTGLIIALVLYMRDRPEWVRWMRRYLAISFAALAIYFIYPMAPPWMASQDGAIGPVQRITSRGWEDLGLSRINMVLHGVGNQVAAMPSLHTGMACMVAFYGISRLKTPWRYLLIAYPLTMSFALIYFGEHYVIDVVAGALLAVVVLAGCHVWESRHPTAVLSPGSPEAR
jgi:membrane-associated phospholipid phosphatase